MSSQQQLELLKQGVDVWDAWRRKHPAVTPDLNEEDLSHARLVDANLMESILLHITLDDADLTGAYVKGAHMSEQDNDELVD